jgi:hypothetical protein
MQRPKTPTGPARALREIADRQCAWSNQTLRALFADLLEIAWLASAIGALSILGVLAGMALAAI